MLHFLWMAVFLFERDECNELSPRLILRFAKYLGKNRIILLTNSGIKDDREAFWFAQFTVLSSFSGVYSLLNEENVQCGNKDLVVFHSKAKISPNPNCALLLPNDYDIAFPLRLDSSVYKHKTAGNTVEISEIYAYLNGERIVRKVAIWSDEDGLRILQNDSIWRRRSDLLGLELKAGFVKTTARAWPTYDNRGEIIDINGRNVDIVKILAKRCNFTVSYHWSVDKWGSRSDNGTWNGLIGMLTGERVDIGAAYLTMTPERADAVDFSVPIDEEYTDLIIRRQTRITIDLFSFLQMFSGGVWISTAAFVLVAAILILLMVKTRNNKFHEISDKEKFGLLNALSLIIIGLYQREYGNIERNSQASKMVLFVVFMACFALFTTYNALMISVSTVPTVKKPIKELLDVNKFGYKLVTMSNSYMYDFITTAKSDSPANVIYKENFDIHISSLSNEAILQTLLDHPKTVLFGNLDYFNSSVVKNLLHLQIAERLSNSIAFAFQRDAEIVDMINYHLLKMKQSGLIRKIFLKWPLGSEMDDSVGKNNADVQVDFASVTLPFTIGMLGIVGGISCLIIEFLHNSFC